MDPVALSDFLSMVKALTGAHPATSAPGLGSPPGHIRAGTGDWRDRLAAGAQVCKLCSDTLEPHRHRAKLKEMKQLRESAGGFNEAWCEPTCRNTASTTTGAAPEAGRCAGAACRAGSLTALVRFAVTLAGAWQVQVQHVQQGAARPPSVRHDPHEPDPAGASCCMVSIRRGVHDDITSRTAWHPARNGAPPSAAFRCVVSHAAWYPTRHRIPHGMVSDAAAHRTRGHAQNGKSVRQDVHESRH